MALYVLTIEKTCLWNALTTFLHLASATQTFPETPQSTYNLKFHRSNHNMAIKKRGKSCYISLNKTPLWNWNKLQCVFKESLNFIKMKMLNVKWYYSHGLLKLFLVFLKGYLMLSFKFTVYTVKPSIRKGNKNNNQQITKDLNSHAADGLLRRS